MAELCFLPDVATTGPLRGALGAQKREFRGFLSLEASETTPRSPKPRGRVTQSRNRSHYGTCAPLPPESPRHHGTFVSHVHEPKAVKTTDGTTTGPRQIVQTGINCV